MHYAVARNPDASPSALTPSSAPGAERLCDVTVVVPCFNEADSIEQLRAGLARLQTALDGCCQLELLLVDDGSTDGTYDLLHHHFDASSHVSIVRHDTNRGIAAAIATGIAEARTDIVASLDADCTYDPVQLAEMLPLLTAEVDMVVASPYHPRGAVEGCPAWRIALSRIASRLYRLVLYSKLHTYTSCVRVYRRSAVVNLPLRDGGFVGVAELTWQLDRRGGTIIEHPAVLTVRKTGHSKMRIARTAWAHLKLILRAACLRVFRARPSLSSSHVTHALLFTLNATQDSAL
jgi:dolichol-phosphate mannosyltransferase